MKYTAFLSKMSVEEVSFEASSPEQALTVLGKLIKEHDNASNAIVRYALTNAEGEHHLGRNVVLKNVTRVEASPLPEANGEAMQAYFLDQFVKSLSVVEGLAYGLTPRISPSSGKATSKRFSRHGIMKKNTTRSWLILCSPGARSIFPTYSPKKAKSKSRSAFTA